MIKRGCPDCRDSLFKKISTMKKMLFCLAFLLPAAFIPAVTRAQFLKTLMNNAKNSIAGKNNTNSTTGKKDSANNAATLMDTTAIKERLAQLQKANAGPSVSPADSAAAIQGFKTATGGSGYFYQFLDTYDLKRGNKDSVFKDTMSMAITDGHNTRTDMGGFGGRTELLGHAGMPRYSLWLDEDARTYRLNVIDTAAINRTNGTTYQVTKVGTETVQGYSCIHSKLTILTAGSKTTIVEDIWTSTDVPGYTAIEKMMVSQRVTPQMMKALEQAGCNGFFVKMSMHSTAYSLDMVLVKATRKTFPASDFEIPSGYTAASNVSPFGRMFQK
jgi:Domain of unknown function (DUF4412)